MSMCVWCSYVREAVADADAPVDMDAVGLAEGLVEGLADTGLTVAEGLVDWEGLEVGDAGTGLADTLPVAEGLGDADCTGEGRSGC